jgi:hypothetical protein
MSYLDVLKSIEGLTHYYPLNFANKANDVIGTVNGTIHGGVKFRADGAHFDGDSWIELPDSKDFSAAGTGTGGITIIAYLTVDDWTGRSHNNEYLHWMGKGRRNEHEWVFRTYVDGGGGEARTRRRRTSFYAFNPEGGLGTGSYAQTGREEPGEERMIAGVINTHGTGKFPGYTRISVNGVNIDKDALSSYSTVPRHTPATVGIGSRGDSTGWLRGRIRRVAFYNRELQQAELARIYAARTDSDSVGAHTGPTDATRKVRIGTAEHNIDAVDVQRKANQLVLYTPEFGASTKTNEYGTELVVRGGKIAAKRSGQGNTAIPKDGYVLSAHGNARTWLDHQGQIHASVIISPSGLVGEHSPPKAAPAAPAPAPEPKPEPRPQPPTKRPAEAAVLKKSAEQLRKMAAELDQQADHLLE